jgi:hypothetical protein
VGWASASEIFDPVARALIDLGAAHDRQKHGGDGRVPDWMLIERGADR